MNHPLTHKRIIMTLAILTLLTANISNATSRSDIHIPGPLQDATTAYKKNGVTAFLPALFNGPSTQDSNKHIVDQTNTLRQVERYYGKYMGLEMIDAIYITESTSITFFIMKYQKGPLFGVITMYKTSNAKENITGFKIHTEIHKIIPVNLLSKYADT